MKKTFLSIALMTTASCSFAHWITSGTNIYNSNTWKVGMGTTFQGDSPISLHNETVINIQRPSL